VVFFALMVAWAVKSVFRVRHYSSKVTKRRNYSSLRQFPEGKIVWSLVEMAGGRPRGDWISRASRAGSWQVFGRICRKAGWE
jgi:hypothetical protein